MRIITILLLFLMPLFTSPAFANDATGKIIKINEDTETITLNNGKDYRLPGEFDYSTIETGMPVILTFEIADNIRYVSTIEDADE